MSASVFPARAGMSRLEDLSVMVAGGVPRASGDEPRCASSGNLFIRCSPRERG